MNHTIYDPNRLWECNTCHNVIPETCVPTQMGSLTQPRHPCGCGGGYRMKDAEPVSHLESVPISPHIADKVAQILKERGFPQYQ